MRLPEIHGASGNPCIEAAIGSPSAYDLRAAPAAAWYQIRVSS